MGKSPYFRKVNQKVTEISCWYCWNICVSAMYHGTLLSLE